MQAQNSNLLTLAFCLLTFLFQEHTVSHSSRTDRALYTEFGKETPAAGRMSKHPPPAMTPLQQFLVSSFSSLLPS